MEIKKTYTNGDITVLWQPRKCIHSGICWRGLIDVFDPRRRPWIDMSAGPTELIKEQVLACPSGALSLVEPEAVLPMVQSEPELAPNMLAVENAKAGSLEIRPKGPIKVEGKFLTITNEDGSKIDCGESPVFLCRCGLSSNKPYCDGSHKNWQP